jgi:ribonuclease BN (tRNA processing enzyme)
MKIWILGSGTLRPDACRGAPGYWLECGEERILMDCGSGAIRTLARLGREWDLVSHLLLSHFHTDHVADLAPLLFALKHGTDGSRSACLTILGPPGLSRHVDALAQAHGDFIFDPGFPVELVELSVGDSWTPAGGAFRLRTFPTHHTEASMAFRLETGHGALGYTGDTGPDPALGRFMSGCDLLVAECSNPDGTDGGTHLTPATLGEIASLARARLLVTVHAYPPLRPEEVPDLLMRSGYRGRVLPGRDGLALTISNGEVFAEDHTP